MLVSSATPPVNNGVARCALSLKTTLRSPITSLAPVRTRVQLAVTSLAQLFDRSHQLNADTHSQVMTMNVLLYTACAPRSYSQTLPYELGNYQ